MLICSCSIWQRLDMRHGELNSRLFSTLSYVISLRGQEKIILALIIGKFICFMDARL